METADKGCALTRDPTALVFPGVGVRLFGEEPRLFKDFRPYFKPPLDLASAYCGVDLVYRLAEGSVDALPDDTRQFFTYAFSAGAADLLVDRFGVRPTAAAGYSFGIYGALYAARVLAFEEGLRVLDQAYHIMRDISKEETHGMGIVVGLTAHELEEIIIQEGLSSVLRTNTNHDLCLVFSGARAEIGDFLSAARAAGAFKAVPLDVTVPYHHPVLLASAPDRLAAFLKTVAWARPRFPVVSSISAAFLMETAAIVDFVAKHLATPIHWERAVGALDRAGVKTLFECGPGISLSQNGRFLPFDMHYINVKKARRCQGV